MFPSKLFQGIDAALGVEIWQDRIQWNTQRFTNVPVHSEANKEVVDEPKSLQKTGFPLSPEQLIQKTRAFTSKVPKQHKTLIDLNVDDIFTHSSTYLPIRAMHTAST